MKIYTKFTALVVISCIPFLSTARAQLITYQTITDFEGSTLNFSKSSLAGSNKAEVFYNILGIYSLTYRFYSTSTASTTSNLSAKFGEWNAGTKVLVGTITDFGVLSIPGPNSWTNTTSIEDEFGDITTFKYYDKTITFTSLYTADPSKEYAMLLHNTSTTSSTPFGVGVTNSDLFRFGQAFTGTSIMDEDFTFSEIVIIPLPVPEASTTAAFASCGLVGILAALRRRQKQNQVAA
ncbi:MAG: hypothetical protein WC378_02650 [Opitutaceae bacterium]|jgi:hypothetical protein